MCLIRSRPSLVRHVWRWMLFTVTLMSWEHKKKQKKQGKFLSLRTRSNVELDHVISGDGLLRIDGGIGARRFILQ